MARDKRKMLQQTNQSFRTGDPSAMKRSELPKMSFIAKAPGLTPVPVLIKDTVEAEC